MNWHNEFNLQPGVYEHHKGSIFIVMTLVTHMDNVAIGKMEPLTDPLVVYRDLTPVVKLFNGRKQAVHQVYARPLSEFRAMTETGKRRFKPI